jgi:hypothetical protein
MKPHKFALRLLRLIRKFFRPSYNVTEHLHYNITEPVAKVTCGDNEVMVFRLTGYPSPFQMDMMRTQFIKKFGEGKVLLLSEIEFIGVFPKSG